MKGIITVITLLALPLLGTTVSAQSTGSIAGTLEDASSGDALIGANVVIEGTSIGSATNTEGEFIIRNVQPGTYTLLLSYVGYQQDEVEVEVVAGERLELDLEMTPVGLVGEEVILSVQAQGQAQAINQQLSNRSISNIVSADRIREIPDVNAAESIGRLPGVSIQRSGGEASKVAIRGLSPKYNAIMVGGVRLPATDRSNRSVDLSMVAPNMLDGIEVTKAITADQDADAIGGTVDLRLRRAPEGFHTDLSAEGGFNQLHRSYENYKIGGSVSDRLLDDRFGAIVNFNLEGRDRSTDTYNAGYSRERVPGSGGEYTLRTNNLTLRENNQRRTREGGSLFLDYRLPDGEIVLNTFYNVRENDQLIRDNYYGYPNENQYELAMNYNELTVWSNMLAVENDFDLFNISATVSYSESQNYSPEDLSLDFHDVGASMDPDVLDRSDPRTIPEAMEVDISNVYAYSLIESTQETEEDTWTFQSDVNVPFRFGFLDGYLEFGGKHKRLSRFNNQDGRGILGQNSLMYGGGGEYRRYLVENMEGWSVDPTASEVSRLPLSDIHDEWYSRTNFLPGIEGDWPVGIYPHEEAVREMHDVLYDTLETDLGSVFSNDYEGEENLWAGYAMTEINIGRYIMLLPGVRYEQVKTDYSAMFTRVARIPRRGDPGAAITPREAQRTNDFILPMYHLQISPSEWMDVRFARTHSITRPDYMQYNPRLNINYYGDHITAGNPDLNPSEALNHDISFSIYTNEIGLFNVSAFHKKIEGLIWNHSYPDVEFEESGRLMDIDYPEEAVRGVPTIHTSLNNVNDAYYRGVEFDFQTNFWWLPRPFDGIVLSANYTRIDSEMEYPVYYTESVLINPPFRTTVLRDSTRTGRLPDQPRDIANIQVGYDYGGFSARVSFLYQGETLQSLGSEPLDDHFTEEYFRIDARIRQRLGQGFELFANLNNVNNRPDRNFQSALGQFPTYVQSYGATYGLGVRFRY